MEEIKNIFDEIKTTEKSEITGNTENSNFNKINEVVLIARPYDKEMLEISKRLIDKYLELGFIKSSKDIDELILQLSQKINELFSELAQLSQILNSEIHTNNINSLKIKENTEELKNLTNHIKTLLANEVKLDQNITKIQNTQNNLKEIISISLTDTNNKLLNYLKIDDFKNEKELFKQNFSEIKIKLDDYKIFLDKLNEDLLSLSDNSKQHKDGIEKLRDNLNNLKNGVDILKTKIDNLEVKEFIINNNIKKLETKILDVIDFFNKFNELEINKIQETLNTIKDTKADLDYVNGIKNEIDNNLNLKADLDYVNGIKNEIDTKIDLKADLDYVNNIKENLNSKINDLTLNNTSINKEVKIIKENLSLKADNLDLELIKSEITALKEHDNLQDTQIQDIKLEPIITNVKKNEQDILQRVTTDVFNEKILQINNIIDTIKDNQNISSVDINNKLDTKADLDYVNNIKNEIGNNLNLKANKSELDTKTDLDYVNNIKNNLDTKIDTKADKSELTNYVLKTDLDLKANKSELDLKADLDYVNNIKNNLDLKANIDYISNIKTDLESKIDLKSNKTDTYSKLEVDNKLQELNSKIPTIKDLDTSSFVTKIDFTNSLDLKADKSELTNYALKTELPKVDDLVNKTELTNYALKTDLDTKANLDYVNNIKNDLDTKANLDYVNNIKNDLDTKANKTDVYSKIEIDDLLANFNPVVPNNPNTPNTENTEKTESVNNIDLNNYYTKTEILNQLNLKLKDYQLKTEASSLTQKDLDNLKNGVDLKINEVISNFPKYDLSLFYNKKETEDLINNKLTNVVIDSNSIPDLTETIKQNIANITIDKEGLINKKDLENLKLYYETRTYSKTDVNNMLGSYVTNLDLNKLDLKYAKIEDLNNLSFDYVSPNLLNEKLDQKVDKTQLTTLAPLSYVENEIRKLKESLNTETNNNPLLPKEEIKIDINKEYMEANVFSFVSLTDKLIQKGVINAGN